MKLFFETLFSTKPSPEFTQIFSQHKRPYIYLGKLAECTPIEQAYLYMYFTIENYPNNFVTLNVAKQLLQDTELFNSFETALDLRYSASKWIPSSIPLSRLREYNFPHTGEVQIKRQEEAFKTSKKEIVLSELHYTVFADWWNSTTHKDTERLRYLEELKELIGKNFVSDYFDLLVPDKLTDSYVKAMMNWRLVEISSNRLFRLGGVDTYNTDSRVISNYTYLLRQVIKLNIPVTVEFSTFIQSKFIPVSTNTIPHKKIIPLLPDILHILYVVGTVAATKLHNHLLQYLVELNPHSKYEGKPL
jgi:hypothetical protein